MNISKHAPSAKSQVILKTLQAAVAHTLDKKKRLGQYAVIWENDKPVLRGEDAPPTQVNP